MSIALPTLLTFLIIMNNLHGGWLERKAEGWAWYEDWNRKETVIIDDVETLESATQKLTKAREKLNEMLSEAVLKPTSENVKRYIQEQQIWLINSAKFSQVWGNVLLQHPELDPTTTTFATSQYGRQLQNVMEHEAKENLIRSAAQRYGLFLFYEGNNKLSKAFVEVVKAFRKKYNWQIVGISMDGILLNDIENSKQDNGAAAKMNINVFPALVAVDPKNKKVIPLAFGLQALDQIENNTFNQIKNNMETL